MQTQFIIIFLGRSGSSHLVSLLDNHSEIIALGEIFSRIRLAGAGAQMGAISGWFEEQKRRLERAVGFKLKLGDIANKRLMRMFINQSSVRLIVLYRENPVKWAISSMRAQVLKRREGTWNVENADQRIGAMPIDVDVFRTKLANHASTLQRFDSFYQRISSPKMRLTYEELLADEKGTSNRVFEFLGVNPESTESQWVKHTPDDLSKIVNNLDELKAAAPDHLEFFD